MNLEIRSDSSLKKSPSFLGPVPASHNGLLLKLLDEVRAYHHNVEETGNSTPEEVDLVVSGGGMKGYFVTGAFAVLAGLKSLKVVRISGASAGAWCAVFMTCGLHPIEWADTYYTTRLHTRDGLSIADAYRAFALELLPSDAYIRCTGVVHLSISVVTWTGVKNLIVSEFTSNEDLIEDAGDASVAGRSSQRLFAAGTGAPTTCFVDYPAELVFLTAEKNVLAVCFQATIASCTIPFFSAQGFGRRFRGLRVLDGGITDNTPVFKDNKRRQIVFQLTDIAYPFTMSLRMVDSCIEALILRGAIQMGRFLEDGPSVIDCIRWYAADGTVIASTRASPASTPQLQNGVAAATGSCPFGAAARMLASIVRLLRKTATALRVISKRAMYILWMYAVQAVRWALRQLRSLVEAKNSESSSSSTSIQNDFSVKKIPSV